MSFSAITVLFGVGIVLFGIAAIICLAWLLAEFDELPARYWFIGCVCLLGICISIVIDNEHKNYECKTVRQTYQYEDAKFFVSKVCRYKDQPEWKIITTGE